MDYKRLTEIDEEISILRKDRHHIVTECDCQIQLLVNYAYCAPIGRYFKETTFYVLVETISEKIDLKIKKLEDEKKALLNKKWYQFWL